MVFKRHGCGEFIRFPLMLEILDQSLTSPTCTSVISLRYEVHGRPRESVATNRRVLALCRSALCGKAGSLLAAKG